MASQIGRHAGHVSLAGAVIFATLAACQTPAPPPRAPGPSPTPTAPPSSTPTPVPPPTTATTGTPAQPPATVAMKPIVPSAMGAKLREIGLDPAALPPLNKLDPKTLRDVMNTFTKALGVQCKYCHEKDFKAPTPMKKVATHMWNDFTRTLALEGGGTLYCDSCHAGRTLLLDRNDLGAVGAWMQENYVDKIKRVDKKDHGCETCHGDPFEGKILTKLWK
jgi:hypothetical protein